MKLQVTRLTEDSVDNILPLWSPSGEQICYVRLTDPDPFLEQFDAGQLALTSPAGTRDLGSVCLLNYLERGRGGFEISPVWIGGQIVYHHPTDGQGWTLRRMDAVSGHGGALERDAPGDRYLTLWSHPTGDRAALWIRRPSQDPSGRKSSAGTDTDDLWILGSTDPSSSGPDGGIGFLRSVSLEGWEVLRARWAPKGEKMAVLLRRRGPDSGSRKEPVERTGFWNIFRGGRKGTAVLEEVRHLGLVDFNRQKLDLLDERAGLGPASWSPSGDALAYHVIDESGIASIRVMNLRDRIFRVISHGAEGGADPLWSPEGDWILFQVRLREARHLAMIRPDGSEEVRLTRGGWSIYPAWSPKGNRILFMRTTPTLGPFYGWKSRLCMIDLTLRKEFKVTSEELVCSVATCCPVWSFTGDRMAFSAKEDAVRGGRLGIWSAEVPA